MKKKLILLVTIILTFFVGLIFVTNNEKVEANKNFFETNNDESEMISVLVDGVEQSSFPAKGSAQFDEANSSCTNGETFSFDEANWKLSVQDISASTRCVVSFITGGHTVSVDVNGGSADEASKTVNHNGTVQFTITKSNENYVFSGSTCTGASSYSYSDSSHVLSVRGVTQDTYCTLKFSRPTYTVYFDVEGGYTQDNYLTVIKGGSNTTTYGAIAGYLTTVQASSCDTGIGINIAGTKITVKNVQASGDCRIVLTRDTSSQLPAGTTYNVGDPVSYANLLWFVVSDNEAYIDDNGNEVPESVTLILQENADYSSASSASDGTGIYGSGTKYATSTARSYINDIWLQQEPQKYLRTAIETNALIYETDARAYLRLPHIEEVSKKIPNISNTNFWTMDNDGNGHIYYGQPNGYGTEGYNETDGKYYYEYYGAPSKIYIS